MNNMFSIFSQSTTAVGIRVRIRRFACLLVLPLVLAASTALAQSQDEEYLRIFNRIQEADSLVKKGEVDNALSNYRELYKELETFRRANPEWNSQVVNYRLNYLIQQVRSLTDKAQAAQSAAEEKQQVQEKAASEAAAKEVKLLEPGAEPRQELRLHPKAGDTQNFVLTTKIDMTMKVGQMEGQAMKMPPMKLGMDVTVKEVSDQGDITYEMVISEATVAEDPGAASPAAEAMKAALGNVKGMSGTGVVTSRGFSKSMDIKMPPGADPQTRQAMEQMKEMFSQIGTPLPEQPVGPGAKWEITMPVKSQGMTINQTSTCELVAIDGDVLTEKITITQSAPSQKISNPAMPTLKMDVTKMNGKGSADVKVDLNRLLPIGGTANVQSEMAMSIDAAGQKQTMNMNLNTQLSMESK